MALALSLEITAETRQAEAGLQRTERAVESLSDKAKAADQRLEAGFRQLDQQLKKVDQSLKPLEQGVGKTAAAQDALTSAIMRYAGPAALVAAATATINYAGKLTDMAAKTGMSVEAVQRLGGAAEDVGVSLDQISTSVVQLGNRLASGDKSAVSALRSLGMTMDDVKRGGHDQVFLNLARAVGRIEDPMKRAQVSVDLFGRSGLTLLPALNGAFADAADKAVVMSTATAKSLDDVGDAIAQMYRAGKVLLAELLVPLAPVLSGLAGLWRDVAAAMAEYNRNTPGGVVGASAVRTMSGGMISPALYQRLMPSPAAMEAAYAVLFGGATGNVMGDRAYGWLYGASPNGAPGRLATNAPLELAKGLGMTQDELKGVISDLTRQAKETTRQQKALEDASEAAAQALWHQARMAADLANRTGWLSQFPGGQWQVPTNGWNAGGPGLYTSQLTPSTGGASRFYEPGMFAPLFDPRTAANLLGPSPNPMGLGGGGGGFNWMGLLNLIGGGAGLFGGRGGTIGQVATGALSGAAMGAGVSGLLSSMVGASVWGPLAPIAAVIGGSIPLIRRLFGPSRGAILGQQADARMDQTRAGLLQQFGSLDAIAATGRAGQELVAGWEHRNVAGERAFNQLVDAFFKQNELLTEQREIQAQIQSIEEQRKALADSLIPTWAQVSEIIARYQIAEGSLGQQINQLATTDTFRSVINDMETLFRAGADVGGVLYGMREEISKLVRDSVAFGTEIPANMRPFIEELARSGNLLDENGNAITDIANLRWGAAVESQADIVTKAIAALDESMQSLVDRLNEIIDKLANGLPDAAERGARGANGAIGTIEGPEHRGGEADGYALGGPVYAQRGLFIPRGTDTVPAMLTPGEFVMSAGATRRIGVGTLRAMNRGEAVGGVNVTVNVAGYLDSQVSRSHLASVVAAEIGRELRVRRRA